MATDDSASPAAPELVIRHVVGDTAFLEVGNARVSVAVAEEHGAAALLLPPRERWRDCVADDFPLSYDEVTAAIREAGFCLRVSPDAGVASTTSRPSGW